MAKKPKVTLKSNSVSLFLDDMLIARVELCEGEVPEITFDMALTFTLNDLKAIVEELEKHG